MSASRKLPTGLTVAEFLAWCPEDGQRWQLVDGEPRAMAPSRVGHGALQSRLDRLIGNHLEAQRSACTVVSNPGVVPKVRASLNFRVPDLGVTCEPLAANDVYLASPVLLVEILSPGNARDSWANVWAYTTIPSVREILVLHTQSVCAELLRREPDGNWPAEPLRVTEGELRLDSIGLGVEMAGLYRLQAG